MQQKIYQILDFLIFWDFKYFTIARNKWIEIESWYVNDNFNKSIKTVRAKQRIWASITYAEAFTKATTAAS